MNFPAVFRVISNDQRVKGVQAESQVSPAERTSGKEKNGLEFRRTSWKTQENLEKDQLLDLSRCHHWGIYMSEGWEL